MVRMNQMKGLKKENSLQPQSLIFEKDTKNSIEKQMLLSEW